jgi:hypothetical protein
MKQRDREFRIAFDIAGEVAKNLAISIPAVCAWRQRRPRARGGPYPGSHEALERLAFLPLRLLLKTLGDVHGEHVTNISSFARTTARLLKPIGAAVHRIDFCAHDCWTHYRDPLTFLRFPDWLWSAAGSQRGTPNRFRHHEFCRAFEDAGLIVSTVDLEALPIECVRWDRLLKRFRVMARESLNVAAVVYVCRPVASS